MWNFPVNNSVLDSAVSLKSHIYRVNANFCLDVYIFEF